MTASKVQFAGVLGRFIDQSSGAHARTPACLLCMGHWHCTAGEQRTSCMWDIKVPFIFSKTWKRRITFEYTNDRRKMNVKGRRKTFKGAKR